MSRICVYKNCAHQHDFQRSVFRFPKDPEAREKWMQLGQAPRNLQPSQYFYCANHFDKRFLSFTQRRVSLVGKAMPFPYRPEADVHSENMGPTTTVSNVDDDDDDLILYETDNDLNSNIDNNLPLPHQEEQDFCIESTTKTTDEFQIFSLDEIGDDQMILNKEELVRYPLESKGKNKRPANQLISSSPTKPLEPIKIIKIESRTEAEKPFILESVASKIDDDQQADNVTELIDSEHVSSFIFKGEEYVQMPREYYVAEKLALLKKMKKMQNFINSIKNQLNTLD